MATSAMLDVGRQCNQSNCHQVDFLPIRCSCTAYFCRDHITPDAHECPTHVSSNTSSPSGAQPLDRCSLEHCEKPSLGAFAAEEAKKDALCTRCRLAFCAEHRYPDVHACTPSSGSEHTRENSKARALLTKHFGVGTAKTATSSSTPSASSSTSPKSVQVKKVEMMKMRHKAVPADPKDKPASVPAATRLHVRVRVEDGEDERIFWLKKTTVAGKALDLLAAAMKVKMTSPTGLFVDQGGVDSNKLDNGSTLASQVEEGDVLRIRTL
ncbi:hypothetical protein CYLTODRAFT_372403 [Cylindrobasidium torrendii FP15055 ss-10]|uniref:AN1-type domain-containing protein n=1 Tax=Cylindrobasidium torrendii FP15055 ss-10 TaxID=1314674 RepID=A0A0D7BGB3_9AGAR|nr:hypothetical protein CYLTODRAFT_372403 [Cylindrobasidium torrendii FP15055 ss-10]